VSGYERVFVGAPATSVVAAIRAALRERGMTEYVVVDHGRDMTAAGAPAYPAWTVVFGDPATGARLLALYLAAAVDIPLRLAVIGTADLRSEIVLRDMRLLLPKPLGGLADELTATLRVLAARARELADAS
jgi:uncharacterized protein (DUF302 family)